MAKENWLTPFEDKMKLDSVDKKFAKLGFEKIKEKDGYVRYEKYEKVGKYTHEIDLVYKESGEHLIQSFVKKIESKKGENGYFETMVGLTEKEVKLCLKKMKKKGWK